MALRILDFLLAFVGIGILIASWWTNYWVWAILYIAFAFVIAIPSDIGKKALKLAVETEDERHEEIENYRKLSQDLCLRQFRKGGESGRAEHSDRDS